MRSRLFRKTLGLMLAIFGVLALASSLLSGLLIRQELEREFSSKAMALADSLAESHITEILEREAATVQARIDRFLEIEGVTFVLVAGPGSEMLAHTFAPGLPRDVEAILEQLAAGGGQAAVRRLEVDGDTAFLAAAPILQGLGGWVLVGMDWHYIQTRFWEAFLKQQALILGVFLTTVAVAWRFVRSLTRPLERLNHYARRVAAHDFSVDPQVSRGDELGELAGSMRAMATQLAEHMTALQSKAQVATDELEDALAYLSAIINSMPSGLLVTDGKGRVMRFNPALRTMLLARSEELLGTHCADLLGREAAETARLLECDPELAGSPAEASPARSWSQEVLLRRKDGVAIPVELAVSRIRVHGECVQVIILRDISERRLAEQAMRENQEALEEKVLERTRALSRANAQLKLEAAERIMVGEALRKAEARYRSIFENAVEGIFQLSLEGRYLAANPALARLFGHDTTDEFLDAMQRDPDQHFIGGDSRADLLRRLDRGGEIKEYESRVRRKDGAIIWISENARTVVDKLGEPLWHEGSVEDVTLRKEMENALKHQAFHDPLTSLPNRMLFQDHLQLALERSKRRRDYLFAVLYMDLDRFKIINDSLGHETGDELLKAVARGLERCVRATDTVARFGGDEFAILLEEIEAPREAVKIARRILEEISRPLQISGHEVYSSASIGIVLVTDGYEKPDSILRDADTAMYKAKEQGKARFKVFNQKMHEQALRIMELEVELRKAVERGEIQVYYQPILDLARQRIAGFEALSRWRHPRHGFVPPSEFIPLAEDTGLIVALGADVLRTACATLLQWHDLFRAAGQTDVELPRMSVNISGKQFLHPTLVADVEDILAKTGLDPRYLLLEITENVLMVNAEAAGSMLGKLKRLGVGVSMDDFGTGYSSLSYLRQFPIDHIKIDRGFVSSCDEDAESLAIIKTVISLGQALNMGVVAEGVENTSQLALLMGRGCHYGQGYLFSRPLPMVEMHEFILQAIEATHPAFAEVGAAQLRAARQS